MRTICVATGTRAEYGILKPLLGRIEKARKLKLRLLACHMHLAKLHNTAKEIKRDGFSFERVPGDTFGRMHDAFSNALPRGNADFLVVLGDRPEALAAVLAAAALVIPIAHVQAGDKIDSGHIDEPVRHSITRFAHVHFAACRSSAKRLEKVGEQKFRIKTVGALGIDSLRAAKRISEKKLFEKLGLDAGRPAAICIQHPVLLEKDAAGAQMKTTLQALVKTGLQTVVIYPNGDDGTNEMVGVIEKYRGKSGQFRVFRSLPHDEFVSLMRHAAVMVGNSSSGIIEAPFLGLPMVHVGTRNRGREHGENVIFVKHSTGEIVRAVKRCTSKRFAEKMKHVESPYGWGNAAGKIASFLENVNIDDRFMRKVLVY